METIQQRRAIANVIANASLLIALFAGLSHNMSAAMSLTAVALSIFTAVARLPMLRRVRGRAASR